MGMFSALPQLQLHSLTLRGPLSPAANAAAWQAGPRRVWVQFSAGPKAELPHACSRSYWGGRGRSRPSTFHGRPSSHPQQYHSGRPHHSVSEDSNMDPVHKPGCVCAITCRFVHPPQSTHNSSIAAGAHDWSFHNHPPSQLPTIPGQLRI